MLLCFSFRNHLKFSGRQVWTNCVNPAVWSGATLFTIPSVSFGSKFLWYPCILIEPCHEKTLFLPYANNKGAGQPAHLRSLISAFVVRCLDSIIPILAKAEISRLASLFSWADRYNSFSCPLGPGGPNCPRISYPPPWLSSSPGASCPGWFILPPTHTGAIT